jgi:hypothetical protein
MKLGANEDFNAIGASQLQPQWSVISLKRDFEVKEWTALAFPGNPLCDFRECDLFALQSKCVPVWKFLGLYSGSRHLPVSSKNIVIGNPL